MLELLHSLLNLILGLLVILWDLVELALTSCWDLLYHLHVSAPRFEGLLIGVTLAWVMMRRDKHPLLRVLSAPLKLIVDVLDLAWDQVVEVISDLWKTGRSWVVDSVKWVWGSVTRGSTKLTELLTKLRDRLRSKKEG